MHHEDPTTNRRSITRARPGLAALALTMGLATLGCDQPEPSSELPSSGPVPTFRTSEWEAFPIVVEGISPSDISNYTYVIDGTIVGLEHLIDVAAYTTAFQPCDLGLQPDADLSSFSYDRVTDYVDAAAAKRLHVLAPLPYLGRIPETEPFDAFACDGEVVLDGAGDPIEMWNHDHTVQIPLHKNDITTSYISYWTNKVDAFVAAVDAYDVDDVVWSWRGLDELRYWEQGDVGLSRAMRDTVDVYDGTRALTAYTPNHYLPESSMINTLLDRPIITLSPYNPMTVMLNPTDPVARVASAGIVSDLYPTPVEVNREVTGALRPIFDHIMTGSYTGWILGANGHLDRIQPLHRAHLGQETRENLQAVYAANGQAAPEPTVFHAPDLSADGVVHMSREEARHDFWAGLHVANGIYLYNFAYRNIQPDVWDAYARGLYLIKAEMRPWLAQGNRWTPTVWSNGAVQTVPGNHYLTLSPDYENTDFLAMPQAPDTEYPTLNATMVAMLGTAYLIVTNSWDQPVDFQVTLPACTLGAELVYGETAALNVVGNTLTDSFAGIDGRVYRVSIAPC